MSPTGRRIGILAGGGSIPREVADSIAARGDFVCILGLAGEASDPFDFMPHPSASVGWGQIGRMIAQLRQWRVEELVIVGRVRRPDLGKVRPDLGLVRALPMIWRIVRAGGDDAVLREVIRFFEGKGLRVVGPGDVAPDLLVGAGALGQVQANAVGDARDIALGLDVVARLGRLDVGQAVVVGHGLVEAIEGVEGTDSMLARVAASRRRGAGGAFTRPVGVLVKRPKPGQELRIDLPAIGPETVTRAFEAGLRGIAVLAGRTIAAERAELVRRADAASLFVEGVAARDPAPDATKPRRTIAVIRLAGRAPSTGAIESAAKGTRVIDALTPLGLVSHAVVAGRHVLAVSAGDEDGLTVLERAAGLRQWGLSRRRRHGVAVLRQLGPIGEEVVRAADAAGLEGIVIFVPSHVPDVWPARRAAEERGMFIARADYSDGGGNGEQG